jgi:AmmeMemoRadiSam system protein B
MPGTDVRKSRFAGSFYPGSAGEITSMLGALKERAGAPSGKMHPPILILPHAGWVYSGLAAVRGISMLTESPPARTVLIGPAHRHYFIGFSIADYGRYDTPLGEVDIDVNLAETLSDHTGFGCVREAHETEHSVEVIVPILKYLVPEAGKIVPILAGNVSSADIERMADALASTLDPLNDVIIISTDLSHFFSYDEARKLDQQTLDLILESNSEEILARSGEGGRLACGYAGVLVAIAVGRRWELGRPEILIYYNSGDSGGDRHSVVGYAALAYNQPELARS